MKRLILSMGLILSMVFVISAAQKQVTLKYQQQRRHDNAHTGVIRAPERIPDISVIYDSEMRTVKVECDEPIEADVFLYDSNNIIIDYSPTVNSTLSANEATAFPLTIYIESEQWTAIAEIEQ